MPTRPPIHRSSPDTKKAVAAQYRKQPRRKELQRMYDWPWRRYSKDRLSRYPFCVECAKEGRTTLATVTDHIEPHDGNPVLFMDQANHQSLCKMCHDRKTAREDGGFGRK